MEITLPDIKTVKDPALQQVIRAVQTLSDHVGSHETLIAGGLSKLNQEMKEVKEELKSFKTEVGTRFESLESEVKDLRTEMHEHLSEQTNLLKMIVQNTKRDF